MGLLSWLRPAPAPVSVWRDDDLGTITWDDDEESWGGAYAGLSFSISPIRTTERSRPSPELVAHAKRILGDPVWRIICLEEDVEQRTRGSDVQRLHRGRRRRSSLTRRSVGTPTRLRSGRAA